MLAFILAILGIAFLIRYFRSKHTYIKDQFGLDGPAPVPVFGNYLTLINAKCEMLQIHEWSKQYGKLFGFYECSLPVIVTSDLSIVQDILVKKWTNFHGHKEFSIESNPDTSAQTHIFAARGLRWKRLRMISNPTFTNSNLRLISPIVHESADIFLERVGQFNDENGYVDIYQHYQEFTLDAIAKLALGETRSLQGDTDNAYMRACRLMFGNTKPMALTIPMLVANIFPELKSVVAYLFQKMAERFKNSTPFGEIRNRVHEAVNARRAKGSGPDQTDFIQLFMEAEAESLDQDDKESMGMSGTGIKQLKVNDLNIEKKLTAEEVVSQCSLFLIAGFDTTSNTLAYATHLLVNHPDKQEKLIQAIDSANFGNLNDITNDDLSKLEYVEWVMKESLRLYPLAMIGNTRRCMSSCVVGDSKLFVPEGTQIQIDPWAIHRDKGVWGNDADEFRPERFSAAESAGRHPMAWVPFGGGPRMCIGMRLAQLEFKLLLIKILTKYRFAKCAKTANFNDLNIAGFTTISPDHVYVKLVPRN